MSATSTTTLMTPFFAAGGLRSVKFFNGRLLSAEDLTTEQQANRQEHEWLGLAIGDGVVSGLEVAAASATTPTVTVQPGLAINRLGDAVQLTSAVDVSLYQPTGAANANAASGGNGSSAVMPVSGTNGQSSPFAQCSPPSSGGFLGSVAGAYLLTVAPALGTQGRAPVLGLADGTDKCNAKYYVDGVTFYLWQLTLSDADSRDTARLQNIVAAKCFGLDVDPLDNPFGPPQTRGAVELLRAAGTVSDAEVPLAVIGWTGSGIAFVDLWSVRRRLSGADTTDGAPFPIGDRDLARAEAIFLQFQSQVASMVTGTPSSVKATSVFKYLPAAGVLPLSSSNASGFDPVTFFNGLTVTNAGAPIAVEGARAAALLRTSLRYPPVDISVPSNTAMLWAFRTRENMHDVQSGTAAPFLIFASGEMPYFGDARFDVARFDYGAWSQ
jgi:hypothetical protein